MWALSEICQQSAQQTRLVSLNRLPEPAAGAEPGLPRDQPPASRFPQAALQLQRRWPIPARSQPELEAICRSTPRRAASLTIGPGVVRSPPAALDAQS